MTPFVALVLTAAAVFAAAAPAGSRQPYPVLVERDGMRVYAPATGEPWGRGPRAPQLVRARDLGAAEGATLLAVPRLYARSRSGTEIDVRGATATAARLGAAVWTRSGLARATCGRRVSGRALAVAVRFPRVNWSASLSSATFFVSRVPDGWIVWHQAH